MTNIEQDEFMQNIAELINHYNRLVTDERLSNMNWDDVAVNIDGKDVNFSDYLNITIRQFSESMIDQISNNLVDFNNIEHVIKLLEFKKHAVVTFHIRIIMAMLKDFAPKNSLYDEPEEH